MAAYINSNKDVYNMRKYITCMSCHLFTDYDDVESYRSCMIEFVDDTEICFDDRWQKYKCNLKHLIPFRCAYTDFEEFSESELVDFYINPIYIDHITNFTITFCNGACIDFSYEADTNHIFNSYLMYYAREDYNYHVYYHNAKEFLLDCCAFLYLKLLLECNKMLCIEFYNLSNNFVERFLCKKMNINTKKNLWWNIFLIREYNSYLLERIIDAQLYQPYQIGAIIVKNDFLKCINN